jgi:hypothetical protein
VQRQNVAAWYVCENQSLWINLGAYLYGTPAGCADQTVSFCWISSLLSNFRLEMMAQGWLGRLLTAWNRSILMATPLRMSEGEVELRCGVRIIVLYKEISFVPHILDPLEAFDTLSATS